MRKVFFIVAILVLVISCAAYAATIDIELIARIPGILLVTFGIGDNVIASAGEFSGEIAKNDDTTIEWSEITDEPTDKTDTYVMTGIYTLKVRSTETWDLNINGDDVLTNEDDKTIDLAWQYGDSPTLTGEEWQTKIEVERKDLPATIESGAFTKYIRFRIPYHWGVYPGEYKGSVSIEATTL